MTSIYDWSVVAADNSHADSVIDWHEGQAPSTVNNSARAMMQRVAEFIKDMQGHVMVSGSANALSIVPNSPVEKLFDGLSVRFTALQDNTGLTSLDFNHLGSKPVYVLQPRVLQASGGELQKNGVYDCVYRENSLVQSGAWLLLNPSITKRFISDLAVPGTISPFAMAQPPEGWLECDGRALWRAQYPKLFAAIGDKWGAGDGKNSFNIPDFRGYFLRGWNHGAGPDEDHGRAFASVQDCANKRHQHKAICGVSGSHSHSYQHTNVADGYGGVRWGDNRHVYDETYNSAPSGDHTHSITIQDDGGAESRPKNKAVLYAIKY